MITTRIIFGFLILSSLNGVALAQKGTAPPGFYPSGFNGDTWSGEVTAVDETKREMTLTHGKDEKAKTFLAYVPDVGMYTSKGSDDNIIVEVGSTDAKLSKSTTA